MNRKRNIKSTYEQLLHCLVTNRTIFMQLDVGSFIMCSMPEGFVERQVNTSVPTPRPKRTQSQLKPEARACQTQKDRELIISVDNRPLSEKTSSP